ncbi:MAG: diguanylate cyclase [Acidobacteria bacterium]|nr:diguanylate cyclase [Acidobacteriota bacterium]
MKELSIKARLYLISVTVLGFLSLLQSLWHFRGANYKLFSILLALVAMTMTLKIRIPGVPGTISIASAIILAATVLLGRTEAILLSGLCGLTQCLVKPEVRPRVYQTVFSIGSLMASANVAAWTYHITIRGLGGDEVPSQIIAIIMATFLYFFVNTLLVSGAIGLTSDTGILKVWHQNFLWSSVSYFAGSIIAYMIVVYIKQFGLFTFVVALPPLILVYYSYRLYLGRIADGQHHLKEMKELHLSTIEALALAIEAKDPTACTHSQRVKAYAVGLANAMKLEEAEVKAIEEAALLHDIGKLAVPDHILCKPGLLTPKEFERIRMHPVVGYEILAMIKFNSPVAEIVLHHHERWDGTGYPHHLRGDQIPVGARILAIADSFEALTAARHHRKAYSPEEAAAHILSQSGKAFEPGLTSLFCSIAAALRADADAAIALAGERRLKLDTDENRTSPVEPENYEAPTMTAYKAIGAANRDIATLYELAQVLGTTLRLNETLSIVALKINQMLPSSTFAIYLMENEELVPRLVEGVDEQMFHGLRIPYGQGISGRAAAHKEVTLNGDPKLEFSFKGKHHSVTYLQSAIAVPLIVDDKVIGVLSLYDLKPNRFGEDCLRLMDNISNKIAVALTNSLIYEQTHEDALTDPVTGLPNSRFLFMRMDQEISRAHRNNTALTVLAMDLDNFKQINDTRGHLMGDKVLFRMSQLLRSALREYDFVARTGGDEFVALIIDASEETVKRKIAGIQAEVAAFQIDSASPTEFSLGISIGYSCFGRDGYDTDTLLTAADASMYRIKNERKHARALAPITAR